MNKEVKKILLVLGLYALSGGIFYNFQELWMAENNLSVKTIGTVFSLCAIISVSVIFLCSNLIKQEKLKKFTIILLLIKTIILFSLFLLNGTGLNVLIKFLIMVDYAADVEIYACIYPMITLINKDDKIYAARGIIYDLLYYIGSFLTGFILGKTLIGLNINYNIYCLLGAIIIFIALIVLVNTDLEKYYKKKPNEEKNDSDILFKLLKNIKDDKISHNYLLFIFTGDISYYTLNGLFLILLTKYLDFTPSNASNFNLILGILAVAVGSLILYKLTFKNNYINIGIKFIGRLITYLLAAIVSTKLTFLLAIIYTKITSDAYDHITSAPYINRFDGEYQMSFANLKSMVSYLSTAIGTFLCGIAISINIKYVFVICSIFITLQIIFAFNALHLRNIENKNLINNKN